MASVFLESVKPVFSVMWIFFFNLFHSEEEATESSALEAKQISKS